MSSVIVAGALANKPFNGGEAWVRLTWAVGMRRLGADVHFVEQIAPEHCVDDSGMPVAPEASTNVRFFERTVRGFGLEDRASLVLDDGSPLAGPPLERLLEAAAESALLLNISGHLRCPPLLERIARRVFVDVDPGFTQIWAAGGDGGVRLAGHHDFVTVGTNVGTPECTIPTVGLRWHRVAPPVLLDEWPMVEPPAGRLRLTTVATWRSPFGPIEHQGRLLGLKVHEFRKLVALPSRVPADCEVALDIDAADAADLAALRENGWRIVDPRAAAATPEDFRRYVQGSSAELSAAQGVYVDTRSGWFSDRTGHYLASGRPAVVQDTGLRGPLAPEQGLLRFTGIDDAAAAVERVVGNHPAHCAAARAFAERQLASDRVLGDLLDRLDVDL